MLPFEQWIEQNPNATTKDAFAYGAQYAHLQYVNIGTYYSGVHNYIFPSGTLILNKSLPEEVKNADFKSAPAFVRILK